MLVIYTNYHVIEKFQHQHFISGKLLIKLNFNKSLKNLCSITKNSSYDAINIKQSGSLHLLTIMKAIKWNSLHPLCIFLLFWGLHSSTNKGQLVWNISLCHPSSLFMKSPESHIFPTHHMCLFELHQTLEQIYLSHIRSLGTEFSCRNYICCRQMKRHLVICGCLPSPIKRKAESPGTEGK